MTGGTPGHLARDRESPHAPHGGVLYLDEPTIGPDLVTLAHRGAVGTVASAVGVSPAL